MEIFQGLPGEVKESERCKREEVGRRKRRLKKIKDNVPYALENKSRDTILFDLISQLLQHNL